MTQPDQPGDDDKRKVSDLAVSIIRTLVPVGVVQLLAWLDMHFHLVLSPGVSAQAAVWLVALATAGYYLLARWLERRKGGSWFGVSARAAGKWMLGGVIRQPIYALASERIAVVRSDGSLRKPR